MLKPRNSQTWIREKTKMAGELPVQVLVAEDELAKELNVDDVMELSKKIPDGATTRTKLASFLGIKESEIKDQKSDKIFNLLMTWRDRGQGSTVRVLKAAMLHIERPDLDEFIDRVVRYKYVSLIIVLHVMYHNKPELLVRLKADKVPGRQALCKFVEPAVRDYIGTSARGLCSYDLKLKKLGPLVWDSLSQEYRGSQVDLYLYKVKPEARPHTDAMGEKRNGCVFEQNRSHTTYATITFGYCELPSAENQSINLSATPPVSPNQSRMEQHFVQATNQYAPGRSPPVPPEGDMNAQLNLESEYGADSNVTRVIRYPTEESVYETSEPITNDLGELTDNLDNTSSDISLHTYNPEEDSNRICPEMNDQGGESVLLQFNSVLNIDNSSCCESWDGTRQEALPNELYGSGAAANLEAQGRAVASPGAQNREAKEGASNKPGGSRAKDEGYSTTETMQASAGPDEEWDEVSRIPGFNSYEHLEPGKRGPQIKADVVKFYGRTRSEGCYMIRPSQSGVQRFTLVIAHDNQICNISIVRKSDKASGRAAPEKRYMLYDRPEKVFQSIHHLVEYYKVHEVKPGIRLSIPVSIP